MKTAARAWPWLGHLPAFRADVPGFLLRVAHEQGDVARFRLGAREAVLFSHPDDVRAILVDHAADFQKGNLMQRARRLLGDGLLTSEGEAHRQQRRNIQPVFAKDRVADYARHFAGIANAQTTHWKSGSTVRVDEQMDILAMNVVARTLLGVDLSNEAHELGDALRRLAHWAHLLVAPGGHFLERTELPVLRRLRDSIELVEATIDRRIAEGADTSPLLRALMQASARHGHASPHQVRDEVMTVFLAGHDTTAAALTWSFLLLANNPEMARRVRAEVCAVGGDAGIQPDQVGQLRYTNMFVKEVLRLYPPISRIGRRPIASMTIRDVHLEAGSSVFVSPYVTHRDSRWFSDSQSFRPERWAAPDDTRPRFAYFPFGAGPRSCIGEHFSKAMIVLGIAHIAGRWSFDAPARMPRHRSLLTLKPSGTVVLRVKSTTDYADS